MTNAPDRVDNWRGLIWALVSVLGASGMAISIRATTDALPVSMAAGYRAVIMLSIVGVGLILFRSFRAQLSFTNPKQHIIRGFLFGISVFLGFYAVSQIPLTTSAVLFFLAPIFASLLSVPLLGQTIGPRRMAATAMGFVGALVILRPGYIPLNLGMLSAVGSSVFFAIGLVMTRDLGQKDGPLSTLLSTTLVTFAMLIPMGAPEFQYPQTGMIWFWLVILALVSMLRQVADIQAYRFAEASVIAPVAYLRLVFIGIAAYFMFDEIPDMPTVIGATIIIGSAFYIAQRERAAKKATSPSARSGPP